METEIKRWLVEYDHNDGRSGTVNVKTEIGKSESFDYGNGKFGLIEIEDFEQVYDLRYNMGKDLHMIMIESIFGKGLKKAIEI